MMRTEMDYEDALHAFVNGWEGVNHTIRPETIIRNGSIGAPGTSDLDLILVFPDEFSNGNEFRRQYNNILEAIPDASFYWVHDPILLPKRLARQLPSYSLNDPGQWERVSGEEICPLQSLPDAWQSALISLEFLQMRLIQWSTQMQNQSSLDQRGVLLRGHSLIHSMFLAEIAGIDLNDRDHPALTIVERVRKARSNGEMIQLGNEELTKVMQGLMAEGHALYLAFASKLERSVHYYLPDNLQYEYLPGIHLTRLFSTDLSLNTHRTSKGLELTGFHWMNQMLRDLYFRPEGDVSVLMESGFRQAIERRTRFQRDVWRWNRDVFGSIHAGLGISPGLSGKTAEEWGARYWGIPRSG